MHCGSVIWLLLHFHRDLVALSVWTSQRTKAARQEADAALRAFAETDPAWLTSKEFLADPEPTVCLSLECSLERATRQLELI